MENERKLYFASQEGRSEEVKRLIYDQMVDVNIELGQDQATPLIEASKGDHKEVVQILLNAGADIDRGDKSGCTPLIWAADHHYYETVKLLLGAGADVNKADTIHGKAPLYKVTYVNYSVEVAKLLLEHGADPNQADKKWGRTPLHNAVVLYTHVQPQSHVTDMIKILIKGGADPRRKNINNNTPMDFANRGVRSWMLQLFRNDGGVIQG